MLAKGPVWGQKSTKWTSRVVANKGSSLLEVGLLRARAQMKVGEVGDPKGLFRTLPSLRKNTLRVPQPIRYSQTLPQLTAISQIFPNNTTYHLMVPKLTEIHRISPDYTRYHLKPSNERKHMPKLATPKQKLNISITSRMKRRIQDIAKDKGISMNDLVVHALQDFIDRSDGTYQNADLVADRLNQVLNSQMAVINQLNQLSRKLDN